jgi:protein-S-isoprenylcysteine O-methyltransferase Ste14
MAPAIDGVSGTMALAAYLLSLTLFLWARRTVQHQPLPIAFSDLAAMPPLVRTGPFALVRHPFYLSYSLTWLAGCAAAPTLPVAIVTAGMLLTYWVLATREEWWLLTNDDTGSYSAYLTETPRFIPRLTNVLTRVRARGRG